MFQDVTDQITAASIQLHSKELALMNQSSGSLQIPSGIMSSQFKWLGRRSGDTSQVKSEYGLRNASCETEVTLGGVVSAEADHLSACHNGIAEFSNSDILLPEVCISSNSNSFEEDMNYEVQQAYKIFSGFLLDKYKGLTSPFFQPTDDDETQDGIEGVQGRVQSQLGQSMCLQRIKEKFINKEYETITEFVADFRLILENCYRCHGVDHWISKQGQKLEIMLEQKLTLLSRPLREKTTLAVTSKGRFGNDEERGSGSSSTRRRLAPRSLTTITVGGHESVMVQALRLEEQQRAKEEKRQRELEKKEAGEMSAKEVEEWEQSLLSQAFPQTVDTVWELPAIGHFLCLAQTSLNLPEIVFFELERCLLMPRCSLLLSKVMSSLLSPPHRRATLHRRTTLPYRRWESELRQRVSGWYRTVGSARNQQHRAEQLGLCHLFFRVLGEESPLEDTPFHLLPFYQRVWLLKGLCDHVYETQKDVQDTVLAQPIHECRESILGYDSKENAYIHFPHFCGADLRIYCQQPSSPPAFPFPSKLVKRVDFGQGTENEVNKNGGVRDGTFMEHGDYGKKTVETRVGFKTENGNTEDSTIRLQLWPPLSTNGSESESSGGLVCKDSKVDLKTHTNSLPLKRSCHFGVIDSKIGLKKEILDENKQSKWEQRPSIDHNIKEETQASYINVEEHSYTGRSPACSESLGSPPKLLELRIEGTSPIHGNKSLPCSDCWEKKISNVASAEHTCACEKSDLATKLSPRNAQNSAEDLLNDKMWTKKRKHKKEHSEERLLKVKKEDEQLQQEDGLFQTKASKSVVSTTIKRKVKKKKSKTGKETKSMKKIKAESPSESSFKLVCTNLGELRELISKIEDELDDMESTKKRLGRWFNRREAVKDLHSTLIRLLNELTPWEPKLVKAYHRNRLRLKKEFDDFKRNPEYNNFIREECVSSSSSDDDYDDEETSTERNPCDRLKEEELEHVPRGLWSGANTRDFDAEKMATRTPQNHLEPHLSCAEMSNVTSAELRGDSVSQLTSSTSQCRYMAWATTSPILHPTSGLPKGYTPIPTLLAKSVGNKVTLMKRPPDGQSVAFSDGQSKRLLVSPSSAVSTVSHISNAQSSSMSSQQNLQQIKTQSQQQAQIFGQSGITALSKTSEDKPSLAEPKNPVQVINMVAEGRGHAVRKNSRISVNTFVSSDVDQNAAEKQIQQLVILPSNLLVKKTEAKLSSSNPQQSKVIHVGGSKVTSPIFISTDVSGFTIPETKIPVQRVPPLKDAKTMKAVPPVFSDLPLGGLSKGGSKGICSVQVSMPQGGVSAPSPITTISSAVSAEMAKPTDPKQELKTVCIRDSQSILVTTRGGNTGIVKVQTSSDQNALGSFPTCPVITISPQFKAFLISKTSSALSDPSTFQVSTTSVPTETSAPVTQNMVSNVPSTATSSARMADPSSIPVNNSENQTKGSVGALSQDSSSSLGSTVKAKLSQSAAVSLLPISRSNIPVASSVSSSDIPQTIPRETTRTGVTLTSTEDRSCTNKYILVNSPSSSNSTVVSPKSPPSSTKPVPGTRVTFVPQPSPTNFTGSSPKLVIGVSSSGWTSTTSFLSQTPKIGSGPTQPVAGISSEALFNTKNVAMSSGVQNQLSGKMTSIGQNIGALSPFSSISPPVTVPRTCSYTSTTTTTGLVPMMSVVSATGSSTQLGTCSFLTSSSPTQNVSPISVISSKKIPTSTATALPTGNLSGNNLNIPANILSTISAQTTAPFGGSTAQTPPFVTNSNPLNIKLSEKSEKKGSLLTPQYPQTKTQTPLSIASTTCTQASTSDPGTVQQRIILNTSTPLTAGTQIVLNNARFVIPSQGLGPGSHVFIITSPAPQVPAVGSTGTGPSAVSKVVGSDNLSSLASILPKTAATLPCVTDINSIPISGSNWQNGASHISSFKLDGAHSLGSALITSTTNVASAFPRIPPAPPNNVTIPSVVATPQVSSPARLSKPTCVSPMLSSSSSICSTSKSSVVATPLSKLSGTVSPLPVVSSLPVGALLKPVLTVPAPFSSSEVTNTPAVRCSLPAQQMATLSQTLQPQEIPVKVTTPSAVHLQGSVDMGLRNTSIQKLMPVAAPMIGGTQTQVVPTVTVLPIVSIGSRTQTLPVATVQPIGSTACTFENVHVGPATQPSTSISSAQSVTSLLTKSQPLVMGTNQSLVKHFVDASALNVLTGGASKLLISPDGAVLSSVQCQVSPAELDAPVSFSNSSTGAQKTREATLQSKQADTK